MHKANNAIIFKIILIGAAKQNEQTNSLTSVLFQSRRQEITSRSSNANNMKLTSDPKGRKTSCIKQTMQ